MYTPNRWANKQTTKAYIGHHCTECEWEEATVTSGRDHPALVIFDVFKGQCTEEVLKMLKDNHIERVVVPANCMDKLQPLDLSVKKPTTEFLRRRFQEWFSTQIAAQLEASDDSQQVNSKQVDMRLSIMKPLGALWLVEPYDYLCSNPSFIVSGFSESHLNEVCTVLDVTIQKYSADILPPTLSSIFSPVLPFASQVCPSLCYIGENEFCTEFCKISTTDYVSSCIHSKLIIKIQLDVQWVCIDMHPYSCRTMCIEYCTWTCRCISLAF